MPAYTPTAQDLAEIAKLPGSNGLVPIPVKDPVTGGNYRLTLAAAEAFNKANQDYKEIYGHDIPVASAYRDPNRNTRVGGAPNSNHLGGNSLDIDRAALNKAKPILQAYGFNALGGTYHGNNEDNHFDFKGAHHQTAPASTGNLPVVSMPNQLPVQQGPADPLTKPFQLSQDKSGVYHLPSSITSPAKPLPVVTPQLQKTINANEFSPVPQPQILKPPTLNEAPSAENQTLQTVFHSPQAVAPQGPNFVQGLGNLANAAGQGIGNAAQGAWNMLSHPVQTAGQVGGAIQNEAQHTQSPLDVVGGVLGGAAKSGADLLNFPLQLPSEIQNAYMGRQVSEPALQIPTGDLEKYLKDKQASSFVGGLLPYIAAEALSGGTATPAIESSLGKRLLEGGTKGAAYGFASSPGSIENRFEGATNMGALGVGLEGFGAVAQKLFPGKAITELTPQELEAIHNAIKMDPSMATANPEALTKDFGVRTDPFADQFRKDFQAQKEPSSSQVQILDANGKPISMVRQGVPTAAELAMEKTAEPLPVNSPEIAKVSALPEGRTMPAVDEKFNEAQQQLNDARAQMRELGFRDDKSLQRYVDNAAQMGPDSGLSEAEILKHQQVLDAVKEAKSKVNDIASGDLKSSADIAAERPVPEHTPDFVDFGNKAEPGQAYKPKGNIIDFPNRLEINPNREIIKPGVEPGKSAQLVGPNGEPLFKAESRGEAKATSLNPNEAVGLTSHDNVTKTDFGADVFHKGLDPEALQKATDLITKAEPGSRRQLVSIAEAMRHVRENGTPQQMQHLLNFLQAGRDSQQLSIENNSLQSGGRDFDSRSVHPFAIEKRIIKPQTEVSNLRKELGSDQAVRDNLVQRLRKYDASINAKDTNLGKTSRSASGTLNKLAARLNEASKGKELSNVYLHSHNLGESTVTGSSERGYRLDRITKSSLTGEAQAIPENSPHQNQIGKAYQALKDFMGSANAPASLKRVSQQLDSGNMSRQSLKDLVDAYQEFKQMSPEEMAKFCRGVGLL